MILLWIVILIFVAIVSGIIYSHHQMKQKLDEASNVDVLFTREAIQNSVNASNTKNIPLSLLEAHSSWTMIDMIVRRYKGHKVASQMTGIDTKETLSVLEEQRNKILHHLIREYPQMLPEGDLVKYTGYVQKRQLSRDNGVPFFEPKDEEQMLRK